MKKILSLILMFCLGTKLLIAQSCDNADFETGTLNSWDAFTGTCCGGGITNPGIVNGRHTVVGTVGFDPLSLDTISYIAPSGGNYSVRLGNSNVGREAEKLTKSFLVTASNTAFTYQYALLLEDPSGHTQNDKPKFEVKLLDQNMQIIPGPCGYYQVTAGPATNTWFKNGGIRFKDWATVGIDLTPYIGQVMTIEFSVEDCGLGGHFGYAYIDSKCGFLDVVVNGFCKGDNDSVFVTAPSGFDSYFWPNSGETTKTIMLEYPQVGDSVIVEITNEAGCSSKILHVFEEKSDPRGGISSTGSICAGEDLKLRPDTFNLDWRFVWTSDDPTFKVEDTVLTVNLLEPTTYYLEILNENGCSNDFARDTVVVEVDTSMHFISKDYGPICIGDSVKIKLDTLVGAYNWSIGALSFAQSDSVFLKPTVTTSYTIRSENQLCSWEEMFKINVVGGNSLPDTIDVHFCPSDDSLIITASFSGFIGYQFDGVNSGNNWFEVSNPVDQQIVELILTSDAGCFDTIQYRINESFYPVANLVLDDDSICLGLAGKVTASGAGLGGVYNWGSDMGINFYNTNSTQYLSTQTSGRFWVSLVNAAGCSNASSTDTLDLFVNDSAKFSLAGDTTICLGDSFKLSPIGGSGVYSWTSSLNTLNSSDREVVVKPTSDLVYYLKITNGDCDYSDYRKVNVYQPNFPNPIPIEFCEDVSSTNIAGPSGYVSYDWIGEGDFDPNVVINGLNGNRDVNLALVTTAGCSDTVIYSLIEIKLPVVNAIDDDTICIGDYIGLSASSSYSQNNYSWTSIPVGYSTSNPYPSVSPSVKTKYVVTYTNNLNCIHPNPYDTVEISVDATTSNSLPSNKEICIGDSTTLSSPIGTGNFSWSSSPSGFTSTDSMVTISPLVSTTYYQTISNYLCSSSDNIYVKVNPLPDPFFTNSNVVACENQSITLQMDNFISGTYLWTAPDNSVSSSSSLPIIVDQGGTYYLQIVDLNGCIGFDSIFVKSDELPITAGGIINACIDNPLVLTSSGKSTYDFLWDDGSTNQSITVSASAIYSVIITNGNCQVSESFDVKEIKGVELGEIPTVFTPNGDGVNDEFIIPIEFTSEYEIKIYNRWGIKVFETNDPNENWNGINGFFKVSNGTYYYMLKFKSDCIDSESVINGFVNVIKD